MLVIACGWITSSTKSLFSVYYLDSAHSLTPYELKPEFLKLISINSTRNILNNKENKFEFELNQVAHRQHLSPVSNTSSNKTNDPPTNPHRPHRHDLALQHQTHHPRHATQHPKRSSQSNHRRSRHLILHRVAEQPMEPVDLWVTSSSWYNHGMDRLDENMH